MRTRTERPRPTPPGRLRRLAVAAGAALALGGCSFLTPPQAFLLPPVPAPVERVPGLSDRLIGVNRVSLPSYLSDGRIAILETDEDGATTLNQSSSRVWADTPERALTLALADAIAARTGAAVLAEPWPIEAAPGLKIEVVVAEAVGSLSGPLRFRGDIRVSDLRRNGLAIVRTFEISVPVEGAAIGALTAAHSVAIGRLADEIADALADRFVDPPASASAGRGDPGPHRPERPVPHPPLLADARPPVAASPARPPAGPDRTRIAGDGPR